ncbi:MAG: hypothetical protein ACR2NR_02225 [Solirubrobacteraceae bacterium]
MATTLQVHRAAADLDGVAGRRAVADPLVNEEVYGKALVGIPTRRTSRC